MNLVSEIALSAATGLGIIVAASGQRYDHRAGVPDWQVEEEFKQDVFTFARVQYSSSHGGYTGGGWGRRGRGNWATDYPDAELNFAYRLQQMTSLKVNPDSKTLEDVASMVFIEYYMQPFAEKHPEYTEEKWIDIIQKTWKKMSDQAHQFVLDGNVRLPEPLVPLVQKALS